MIKGMMLSRSVLRWNNLVTWLDGTSFTDRKNGKIFTATRVTRTTQQVNGRTCPFYYSNTSAVTDNISQLLCTQTYQVNKAKSSVTCWIKRVALNSYSTIWSFEDGSTQYNILDFRSSMSNSSKFGYATRFAEGISGDLETTVSCSNNVVYFCASVFDGRNVFFYVNGNLAWQGTFSYDFVSTNISITRLFGCHWHQDTEKFQGYITDFRQYNCCLTAEDVRRMYSIGIQWGQ